MPAPADEQTLRNIVEAAPDGILVVDAGGRIRIVNTEVERLFGYARDELIGERVEMLVPGERRATHDQHRAAYDRHPATRPMGTGLELHGLRKDGSEFPVEISLSPMDSADGHLVTAIGRDVTAQREIEEERQRLLGAVEAQLVRDAVARDLHDEIIQAVYAVGLNLQAAAAQDELSKDQALERARGELGTVIADLRSYIQHLTDEGSGATTRFLETRLRSVLEQRQRPPTWSVAIDLGDHPSDVLDRDLYLLARELISNVERHAEADRAAFSLRAEDGKIVLEVRDFGRGFERARVHSRGSVGLRSVEQRVADLGGSVLIESMRNEGTTVTASVPLQP